MTQHHRAPVAARPLAGIESPDGLVRCWLCAGEVIVTARIVQAGHPIIDKAGL